MNATTHIVAGKNPVLEALQQGMAIEKIYVAHGQQDPKTRQIYRLARQQHIPIVTADQRKLHQLAPDVRHQGVVAMLSPIPLLSLDALFDRLQSIAEPHFIAVLDRIQDTHNLGAIIRSVEVLGGQGIILPVRESAPITPAVIKTSAGAIFHLPIARVSNLRQAVQSLKDHGYWIYGSAMTATTTLWEVDFRRPCAIIIGNEARGIRSGLLNACDTVFKIPQKGKTESLNASVAAGIIFAEFLRQNAS